MLLGGQTSYLYDFQFSESLTPRKAALICALLISKYSTKYLFLTGPLSVVDLVAGDRGHDSHGEGRPGDQVEGRLRVHNVAAHSIRIPGVKEEHKIFRH